jgi:hypothetical protein
MPRRYHNCYSVGGIDDNNMELEYKTTEAAECDYDETHGISFQDQALDTMLVRYQYRI